MKKIFFQKCSLNYIFFLLHIISYFLSISVDIYYSKEDETIEQDNIYYSSIEMINIYIFTLSNFLGIIPFCFLKKYSRGKKMKMINF